MVNMLSLRTRSTVLEGYVCHVLCFKLVYTLNVPADDVYSCKVVALNVVSPTSDSL